MEDSSGSTSFISKITKPFVWFLSISTNSILRLFGIKDKSGEEKISREEIRSLVELGEEQGAINQTERTMIDGIIKFDDILAREIMTPRTETFCIEANSNIKENINLILEENYSRIPVYENEIDNIVGVIYMKDIFSEIIKQGIEEKISREEIRSLVELGEEQGAINQTERTMIDGIIKFDDILAREIMTPRTETFCIEANSNIKENINLILEENYSRIPVYENEIDNIVGVIYMKDIFSEIIKQGIENISIKDIMRTPYTVPETKSIDILLKELQSSKNHIAILLDEYGGFSGIVTLEDLLEEVVGDIQDEYDENIDCIEKIDANTYIATGLVSISNLNKNLNLDFKSDSIDTLGGLIIENINTVPTKYINKEITIDSVKFKILSVTGKRINKVQISIL